MASPVLGEFLGTFVFILLGNGVVAGVLLERSKSKDGGWIVITAGWAFAIMIGVFTSNAFGSSDAHLNPAVTLAFAVKTGDYSKLASYIRHKSRELFSERFSIIYTTFLTGKKQRIKEKSSRYFPLNRQFRISCIIFSANS
ncbi:major intrinsic protein [Leptospira borgpetersenii serovar Javanica]|nr:major intrinsic protein [Leptospira borgpetersenii serovar Javanica]